MHLQELDKQVRKLALTVSRLESQGKLPSQTEPNPRHNASAMTLRSGKVLEPVLDISRSHDTSRVHDASQDREKLDTKAPVESAPQKSFAAPPLFPGRLVQCKKERDEKEILDTFRKVEINIPLLDTIKQIPRYEKFLKDLCTSKRKLLGNEKETGVIIQLADRSVVHPEGVLEDILVKVNELIFSADFYIIDMEDDNSANASDILLERPFLSTAQTKIDVRSGILTMEFDGEVVKFNVYKAMNRPSMISNSKLSKIEEKNLVRVLRDYKEVIGWTIADIKGLSPSTCMHKIWVFDNAVPKREAQRRLNPPMMEVVRKEVQKLLDTGMIYPISDSSWVSPVHVVPKRTGVTVIENSTGKMVPTRVQNGWRVCIDYRKVFPDSSGTGGSGEDDV
ncbi:uncharacterized protein [Gossypium hirsutum]|uniref:Uncharacterized protein n=1 Tax=Gossypium hirsutum TaxID=3635 RepID=A0ABM2ZBS7_GOSHI|nr:uncharacterized protein LOC121211447 [Gossypium hirsutum]